MSHSDGKEGLPKIYSIFHGEVASLQAYGAFVKIPGCKKQGLVHKSQMSSARIEDPSEMLAKGEMVYCKIIGFEGEGEKISLSMKVVNQTTGKDLDPNNVQLDQDAKKRRQWKHIGKEKIELGAELNTTCRRCGGHGHLTIDCFAGKDGTQYDLIPDLDTLTALPPVSDLSNSQHRKKKKKKEKKGKKKARKKKRSSPSSASNTSEDDDDDDENRYKSRESHSNRDKSHKIKEDDYKRKRTGSDKHKRSPSSSPENAQADKRERRGHSGDRSDESSPTRQHSRGKGEYYPKKKTFREGSPARSHDKRQVNQSEDKRRQRQDSDGSFSSDHSPTHKHKHGSKRPNRHARPGRQDSGDQYHHGHYSQPNREVEHRARSSYRSSGTSDEEDRVKVKNKDQISGKDSYYERSVNVDKYSQGERANHRQSDHSSKRSERSVSHEGDRRERSHRSRSSSRVYDKKRKKRRTRSRSGS